MHIQTVDFGKFARTKCISVNAEIMQAKLYFYTEIENFQKVNKRKLTTLTCVCLRIFYQSLISTLNRR